MRLLVHGLLHGWGLLLVVQRGVCFMQHPAVQVCTFIEEREPVCDRVERGGKELTLAVVRRLHVKSPLPSRTGMEPTTTASCLECPRDKAQGDQKY